MRACQISPTFGAAVGQFGSSCDDVDSRSSYAETAAGIGKCRHAAKQQCPLQRLDVSNNPHRRAPGLPNPTRRPRGFTQRVAGRRSRPTSTMRFVIARSRTTTPQSSPRIKEQYGTWTTARWITTTSCWHQSDRRRNEFGLQNAPDTWRARSGGHLEQKQTTDRTREKR